MIQTDYRRPLNQWSQYVPRELTEEDKGDVMESDRMGRFVKDVTPAMEAALQQNEIINVFRNDWEQLNPGKSMMSERQETYLKEYQSFQDLHYSKDKQIICEDWHATIPGLVGVSCVEQMSYDVRLRNMSRIMMVPSLVLMWNYQDPIHPRLLLESPDDCFVFRFNPVNPNIVAGGCISGRIVIWDLTQYYGRLAMTESSIQMKKLSFLSSLVEDNEGKIPVVQPVASTHIDFGHSSCVTDLQWLLPPYVVDRQGRVTEDSVKPEEEECHQIISCAGDDHFLVWDITPQKPRRGAAPEAESHDKDRWQLLNHNWRPVIRIFLPSRAAGIPYSICQFRLKNAKKDSKGGGEVEESGEKTKTTAPEMADDVTKSPVSIYAGTQAGDVLFTDLRVRRDSDTNRTVLCELHEQQVHAAPIRSICISPFFDDMVLTVGGFRFAVWKVGIKWEPLMVSAEAPARRTSGAWSLSRPSMFFIGRQDGSVEVWDMLDRAQEPLLSQNLSGVEVTSLNIKKLGRRQVLSVSDNSGNLHLLEIPLVLSQLDGDEQQMLENLFKRETTRQEIQAKKRAERQAAEEKTGEAPPPESAEPPEKSQDHPGGSAAGLVQMAQDDFDGQSVYDGYLETEGRLVNQLAGAKDTGTNESGV
ncbi:WD repeat-containing protein 63 [Amphibalanus amphitrite]|uniref:WD repeat-containing protein 63 n=2 Tax=Amphibalanus amphitrite TaxID=1232801 RepID=A0A6A4VWH0_AMPAM|nr:WD repeat-containing protein 63 [Amphibalanus amphitrite]